MAGMKSDITISVERRPCYVGEKRAMFHMWFEHRFVSPTLPQRNGEMITPGGQETRLYAVVEFQGGGIDLVPYDKVTFADGGGFGDTGFFPREILDCDK